MIIPLIKYKNNDITNVKIHKYHLIESFDCFDLKDILVI
jgi:hypothetical protein